MLELNMPLDTRHPTYSKERGSELAVASQTGRIKSATDAKGSSMMMENTSKLEAIQLSGSKCSIDRNSRYFVAIVVNGRG